jgi:hypothetical protein
MKYFRRIMLVLVVLVVILLLILNYGMGAIVKTTLEQAGPSLLGAPISLEKAHFRLLQGVVHLKGFVLGNPDGFKTKHAISVGEVDVKFSVPSLFKDTLVITSIRVKEPEIIYELGLGKSNIGRILEKISGTEKETDPIEETADSGKKVIIEDFLIEDASIRLSATLAMGGAAPIPLPDIHLKDIGKEEGKQGASVVDVIRKVFGSIVTAATQVFSGTANLIGDGASAVGAEAGKMVGGVKNLLGFSSDSATNAPPEGKNKQD